MGGKSRSCQDAADTLKRCLAESDCVKKEGNSMEHCVKYVEECKLFRNAYVICKRGLMDPRSRIQGLKGT